MFKVDMTKLAIGCKVLLEKDDDAVLETVTKMTSTKDGGLIIYTDWYTDKGISRRDWYWVKADSGLRMFSNGGWDVAKIYA